MKIKSAHHHYFKQNKMNKKILTAISFCALFVVGVGSAVAQSESSPIPKVSEAWRFEVTPYLFVPGIQSTLNFDNRLVKTANISESNVVSNLKSGGMISAEAHYGKWGLGLDFLSATLQKSGSTPISVPTQYGDVRARVGEKSTLQATIFTAFASYTAINNKDAYVDALLGVRTVSMTASLGLALQEDPRIKDNLSKTTTTVDPIVGFKGRYRIADSSWYVPFYGDIGSGGGTTNVTWQAMLGVGKTFNQWVDASLTYRALYYDMSGSGLLQKTTFQGPQVGVTFKF